MTLAAGAVSARGRHWSLVRALLLLAVLAAWLVWQRRWGTIPDTSWGITMAERLLGGERLYADIIETNPPLTVWLNVPPVALGRWLGWPAEPLVQAWTIAAILLGIGLAGLIARRADPPGAERLAMLSPAILAVLVLMPGNAFGEREHYGVALLLPLLALQAWRADGGKPGTALVVAAALSGSVIVLLKPYFGVAILAPALVVAWRRRSVTELFRAEYWIIGLVCLVYLEAVRLLYPAYFTLVYPLLADTYLQIRVGLSGFAVYLVLFAFLGGVFLLLRPRSGYGSLPAIAASAATASLLPLLYQGKGWPYHAYPALALMALALLCLLARRRDAGQRWWPGLLAALAIVAAALPFMPEDKHDPDLVAAIRAAGPNPSVDLIGMDIASGHPLTRMGGGHWIAAYCSDWLGGMALSLGRRADQVGNAALATHYQAVADRYFGDKAAGFRREPPDVIIVEKNDGAAWNAALRKAGFDDLLASYRVSAETGDLKVMVRAK